MNHLPRSVPDVAEHLMCEFDAVCSPALVTEIVMRLVRNGAVSLAVLTDLARGELTALAGPLCPTPTARKPLPSAVASPEHRTAAQPRWLSSGITQPTLSGIG